MSYQQADEANCSRQEGAIALLIEPRADGPGRVQRTPGATLARAPHGRAIRVLRSHGTGGVSARQGHRRAAASAYRHRDDYLPVRGRDHAPRQPRRGAAHSGRRGQPDGRRSAASCIRSARALTWRCCRICMAYRAGLRCQRPSRNARPRLPTTARRSCRR